MHSLYFDSTVEKTKESENFEGDFPINFLVELSEYKKDGNYILAELQQIQEQVNKNPDIFVIEETTEQDKTIKKVEAKFQIIIKDKVTVKEKKKEKELFNAVYTYIKNLKKIYKV